MLYKEDGYLCSYRDIKILGWVKVGSRVQELKDHLNKLIRDNAPLIAINDLMFLIRCYESGLIREK